MRLFVSTLALTTCYAASALACSRGACFPNSAFPAAGSMPANMVQLQFRAAGSHSDAYDAGRPMPRLRANGADAPFTTTPVTTDPRSVWLAPTQPLTAGTMLRLEAAAGECEQGPFVAEYNITEAKPLPTALGTVDVRILRGQLQVSVINGSCRDNVDAAYADLAVQLSGEAMPYQSLFRYALEVDGDGFPSFSASLGGDDYLSSGNDRLFAVCAKPERATLSGRELSPGKHRVRMRGTLPDGTSLTTPEVELELPCNDTATTVVPGDDEPSSKRDASAPTGPKQDAGARGRADAGRGTDFVEESAVETNDDGCALAARRDGAWLLALALFMLRRRKR